MRRVFLVFNQSELIKHFEVNALSISDRVTASLSSDFCSTNSKLAFSFCFIRGKIHHGFFGGFFAHFIKIISSCLFKGLGMVHAGWCLLTLLGGWCNSEIVAGSCDQCPGKFIHICHHLQHIIKSWELKTVAVHVTWSRGAQAPGNCQSASVCLRRLESHFFCSRTPEKYWSPLTQTGFFNM